MKRAMSQVLLAEITSLILIGCFLLLVIPAWGPLHFLLVGQATEQTCSASVQAANSPVVGRLVELKCPTYDVLVKKDGIWKSDLRSDPAQDLSLTNIKAKMKERGIRDTSDNEARKWMAMYAVASEMESCWSKFGEGKLDPFKSAIVGSDIKCVQCAVVRYDKEFIDILQNSEGSGFVAFLKTTKRDHGEQMYYDYLRPTEGKLNPILDATLKPTSLIPVVGVPLSLGIAALKTEGEKREIFVDDNIQYDDTVIMYQTLDPDLVLSTTYLVTGSDAEVYAWDADAATACDAVF